jgi:hypothetical protein
MPAKLDLHQKRQARACRAPLIGSLGLDPANLIHIKDFCVMETYSAAVIVAFPGEHLWTQV